MGRTRQPLLKRCKALGINPTVMGYDKAIKTNPKETRRKKSEYGIQLCEKQKVRFIYGIQEGQFKKYYVMATKKLGVTGEVLLQILESRLDNVVYRMGLAKTRDSARQLVSHAHITVNGSKVNIPSYIVKVGDVIALSEKAQASAGIKDIVAKSANRTTPDWIEMNKETYTGKVVALAARSDIDFAVKEQLIVEFYSK